MHRERERSFTTTYCHVSEFHHINPVSMTCGLQTKMTIPTHCTSKQSISVFQCRKQQTHLRATHRASRATAPRSTWTVPRVSPQPSYSGNWASRGVENCWKSAFDTEACVLGIPDCAYPHRGSGQCRTKCRHERTHGETKRERRRVVGKYARSQGLRTWNSTPDGSACTCQGGSRSGYACCRQRWFR